MKKYISILFALLAALIYGVNTPFSKLLVGHLSPLFLASLLYFGAGAGMAVVFLIRRFAHKQSDGARLTKHELPYVLMMVLLDVAAPILLMLGLKLSNAATASLLGNFEIVATSVIAMIIFKEAVGARLWVSIGFISLASVLLSVGDIMSASVSEGAVLILLGCICWGFENNCTRRLSVKDPLQVVVIKGFGAGAGALLIAWLGGAITFNITYILLALLLGFVAYGLSIYFYVAAQRELGAARTSACFAAAPFIGVLVSWLVLKEPVTASFVIALAVMLAGTYFAVAENRYCRHYHSAVTHSHMHTHDDGRHAHCHSEEIHGAHVHEHTHEGYEHGHMHLPGAFDRHTHNRA